MKSSGPNSSRKPAESGAKAGPTLSREEAVRQALDTIIRETPDIATAVTGEAKKGNYLAARFLFDFAGISGAAPAAPPDSLAAVLLRQLALETEAEPDEALPSFRSI